MTDQVNEAVLRDLLDSLINFAADDGRIDLEAHSHDVRATRDEIIALFAAHPSRGVVDAGAILAKLCERYIANSDAIGKHDFVKTVSQDGRLADSELGRLWLHALQAAAPPAVPSDSEPVAWRIEFEDGFSLMAERGEYLAGVGGCVGVTPLYAAQPAIPSVPQGEWVTLTVTQIADLAHFAGLTLAQSPQPAPDELEAQITVCERPDAGVLLDGEDADPGVVAHYTHIAYYSEYPAEGCIGLGPEIAATPKDQPAQGEG